MYRIRDRTLHNQFADRELALQRGWRLLNGGADIQRAAAYREVMEFTWHHVERDNVMLLVPTPIHNAAQHAGGIALPP